MSSTWLTFQLARGERPSSEEQPINMQDMSMMLEVFQLAKADKSRGYFLKGHAA